MKMYEKTIKYVIAGLSKRVNRRVFMSAAAIVVFITTYLLILPAFTQSTKVYCGKEEHQHTEECYETEKTLICKQEEHVGHVHDASCYTSEDRLICSLAESEGHTHSEACYDEDGNLICGLEESEGHTHSKECYETITTLTCGQKEEPDHTHSDACYKIKKTLKCDLEEHTHSKVCYSNPDADVETQADWERSLRDVELSGIWAEDLIAIAETQLGYTESTENYVVDEDGSTRGYSRYGDWYGNKYGDWCAMYVSFCLHYADIPNSKSEATVNEDGTRTYVPISANCQKWIETLNQEEYRMYYAVNDKNDYKVLTEGEEYIPAEGDLVFFNWDNKDDADHVGIVTSYKEATETTPAEITTIEGNAPTSVSEHTYKLDNPSLMGFAKLPENPNPDKDVVETKDDAEACVKAIAEYEDYTVTVTYEEGTEIPEGAVLEAEMVEDEDLSQDISEFLESECSYTGEQIFNIRFAVEGETYTIEAPAQVDIAMKNQEEDVTEESSNNKILQMAGKEITMVSAQIAEEDGFTHYRYSQEALSEAALITGVTMNHTLSFEGSDYAVIVNYSDEAKLPEDVELAVSEILGDELQEKCVELSNMEEVTNFQYVRIFDISFLSEEKEYEPEAPVQVQIVRNDLKDLTENMEPGIVHFGEEEAEYIESELKTEEDGAATFEFEGETFSSYASYVSDPFEGTSTNPGTIATVDTKAVGLTINMFDYWGDREYPSGTANDQSDTIDRTWTNGSNNFVFDGVNSVHSPGVANNSNNWRTIRRYLQQYLYFSASGSEFGSNNNNSGDTVLSTSINGFTGQNAGYGGAARQGIVNNTLTDGYPTLSTNNSSLDYLFNLNNATYKRTYADLNHLFKDNGDGYISYSSDNNYAYLDKASGNFKVYADTYKNDDLSMIGFFPFNDYDTNYTMVKGPCTGGYTDKTSGEYQTASQNHYNHHFGLTLSGEFIIPEDCQVEGQDMCFKFSGDDDMWLFVDGVLVMDIGGIHEPCSGEINFKTGEITISGAVDANPGATTTMGTSANIADLFAAAGKTWDNSVDSEHTIQAFYMERGGCYSNLTLTMNLQLFKKNNISVTKEITGVREITPATEGTPDTIVYHYRNSNTTGSYNTLLDTSKIYIMNWVNSGDVRISKEATETDNLSTSDVLRFVDGKWTFYWKNSTKTDAIERGNVQATTTPGTPGTEATNVISDYQDEASDTEFTFQIMAEERTGSDTYAPYVGSLTVTDGTNTRTIQTDENGYFKIKAGEVATTETVFLSTKRYYVNEIGVDSEKYEAVKFNGAASTITQDEISSDEPLTFSASNDGNKIYTSSLGTITNVPKVDYTELSVSKNWYDGNDGHNDDVVKFKIIRTDENGNTKDVEIDGESVFEISEADGWTKTIKNLEKSVLGHTYTYSVEEIDVKEGYDPDYSPPTYDDEGNASITIRNEPKANISVQKKWYKSDGTEWDSTISNSGVQVQLYRRYYKAGTNNSHTVTFVAGNNNWNIEVGTYEVGDGGSISFKSSYTYGWNNRYSADNISAVSIVSGTATVSSAVNNYVHTITNIKSDIRVMLEPRTANNANRTAQNIKEAFSVTAKTAPTISPEESGTEAVGDPVTLNNGNNWSYSWGMLETPTVQDGYTYKYYVKELTENAAFTVSYENEATIPDVEGTVGKVELDETSGVGTVVVKNTLYEYELPHTGGVGTTRYTWGGIGLILSALVLYSFSLRRRRERRFK